MAHSEKDGGYKRTKGVLYRYAAHEVGYHLATTAADSYGALAVA